MNNTRSPWIILMIVLLTSMAAPLNQFKVPPIMPLLMETFRQSAGAAGWLMSAFAITGLILALPAGFIFQRLGIRLTGFIAVLAVALGSALGAQSQDMATMLVSRFVEGAGTSFMAIVAPAILALWFPAESRGKAMGVWAIWVPLGSVIMFVLAPLLANQWRWQGVWWFGFLYTVFVGALFYFFIRKPPAGFLSHENSSSTNPLTSRELKTALGNPNLWLISFLFCCFNFVFIAFVTWAPTFLHEVGKISLARAAVIVSSSSLLSLIACPLSGWLSDRTGSRKGIIVFPMIAIAFLFPLGFYCSPELFLPLAIAVGFIGGFVPTGVFAGGVEIVGDERLSGIAMAVIQIGQNAGMLLGPLVFGGIVESGGGWETAFWVLAPTSIVGAISGWMVKIR